MKNAKKIVAIALSLIMVITGVIPAYAQDNANGSIKDQGVFGRESKLTWALYDDGTLIISGNDYMQYPYYEDDDMDVETLIWKPYKDEIKKVEIREGVKSIMDYAFSNCKNMKEIVIPEGLYYIGEHAFYNCGSLEEIKLPQSLRGIDRRAFSDCTKLKEVRIPDNIEWLDMFLFYHCTALEKVLVPNVGYSFREFYIKEPKYVAMTMYEPKLDENPLEIAVKNVKVVNQKNGIKVSWKQAPDASRYSVWREEIANGKVIDDVHVGERDFYYNETSCIDKTAKSGKTYRYYVYSNWFGLKNKLSEKVTARRLSQPIMKVEKRASVKKISWNKISGASGYQIYRKALNGSKYSKVATIKGNGKLNYIDKSKKKYYYKMRAYYKTSSGKYYYSAYSKSVKK